MRIISDRNSRRSKGIAYVEFCEIQSVPLAIGLTGQRLLGVPIIVQASQVGRGARTGVCGRLTGGLGVGEVSKEDAVGLGEVLIGFRWVLVEVRWVLVGFEEVLWGLGGILWGLGRFLWSFGGFLWGFGGFLWGLWRSCGVWGGSHGV